MAARLYPALAEDDAVHLANYRAHVTARLPVARCDCGGACFPDGHADPYRGTRYWLTFTCDRCAHTFARLALAAA